ncbi:MAG: hypothetical protein HRU38_25130 [Saccharospirillaceae bacterium]|nr:hypothetical protein [Saccharospirillaceae bacterium]
MDQFLAENDFYRVYSISENVYLRNKIENSSSDFYSDDDKGITHHYCDPQGALIVGRAYIVIVGHGITIFPLSNDEGIIEISLFNEPDNQMWTNGVFIEPWDQLDDSRDNEDDQWLWFKFVSKNKVYKMNARTHELKLA